MDADTPFDAGMPGEGPVLRGAEALCERVVDALRGVDDPEVGMNIVELGLVYGVDAQADRITVAMTMTSAACPMGEDIAEDAVRAIRQACPEVADIDVELVWTPPWTPDRMSEEARNFFGWADGQ